ncbi:MAG: efflux RND transporter periplasmic adaptor subunit [Reyranella sp.]|uniref:efflux RND transporter periplasmic adaptor subunit n=1 Tax=Reyranella sp. TaxID=1929291 RepID=UPI001AC6AB63|nr:efflux RND transporter periplasmic adaptor subunit [Reyranella sp.]MBN9090412.1 efflux RND transporter periplasmic adaptor subunit [Reyranella sp.]
MIDGRRLVGAAAIVIVGLGALWWLDLPPFSAPAQKENRSRRADIQRTKVEVALSEKQVAGLKIAAVGQARFERTRSAVGNIDFNQNMLVQVFTPNQGRIIATFANVGDRVEKGQVLFTVDSPDLLTATSNLIQAAGVLVLQNANLKRLTETFRGGGGAQKDVDQVRSDQQTAEGNLRAARNTVRIFGKTEEEIDQIVQERKADSVLIVRSPISGIVTQRTAAPGLLVQPGNAPAPFTVADTSTMWMLANVIEADAPLLRAGQDVEVRVTAYGDRQFAGVITVVGAQVDPATRRLLVRSEIRDPDRLLRAGMFATFTIRIAAPLQDIAVPSAAVVREGDGSMSVWLTTDRRRFEKRSVRTGVQQGGMTQITEGLQPGELVVTDGAIFVSNKAFGVAGASD